MTIIALAVIMFVFFGLCSAVDVAGKAQINGLKVLFEATALGFPRFLSAFILVTPILVLLSRTANLKFVGLPKEKVSALCFLVGVVLCLLFAVTLPGELSLAWGGWMYIVVGILGVAVSRI